MQRLISLVHQKVVTGLLLLIPLTLLGLLFWQIGRGIYELIDWLIRHAGLHRSVGVVAGGLLTLVGFLLSCLLVGWMAQGTLIYRSRRRINRHPLREGEDAFSDNPWIRQPAEDLLKNASTILVDLNGSWQPGVLIERSISGMCVVYVPASPETVGGSVYVVPPQRILLLDIPLHKLYESIKQHGKGLSGYVTSLFD